MSEINDVIFDALLKEAVAANFREKMEAMPSEKELLRENPPSARHIRRMKAIFAMEHRMRTRANLFKYTKAAVLTICIAATLFFALLMTNSGVRAAVRDAIVEVWELFTSVKYDDSMASEKSAKDFSLGYIPSGYVFNSAVENGDNFLSVYTDADNNTFILNISPSALHAVDTEYRDYYTESKNGVTYHVYEANDAEHESYVIWVYENFSFRLSGVVPVEKLIQSAVSLK
jgi:hypothetical protein